MLAMGFVVRVNKLQLEILNKYELWSFNMLVNKSVWGFYVVVVVACVLSSSSCRAQRNIY